MQLIRNMRKVPWAAIMKIALAVEACKLEAKHYCQLILYLVENSQSRVLGLTSFRVHLGREAHKAEY